MSNARVKRVGLIVLALSVIGLVGASFAMSMRLKGRPITPVFFLSRIADTRFGYLNEPVEVVRLSAEVADENSGREWWARGLPALRVLYRGGFTDFPIVGDQPDRLPGLLGYETWFKVLPMVTGERTPKDVEEKLARGEIHSRVIVAARYPAPGFDEGSTGLVRRSEWVYRLAELNPQGPEPFTVVEKTYAELDALHTPGKWTAKRHPEWVKTGEEREHDLWMHYAMQQVTPAPYLRAKDRTLDAALKAMGWTWPAAGVCVVGILAGLLMLGMGSARRLDA